MPTLGAILPLHAGLLLLSLLVGLLIALITWGSILAGRPASTATDTRDNVLVGLLILAAFAFGVFLTYVLLGVTL